MKTVRPKKQKHYDCPGFLGRRLRKARNELGFTQDETAYSIGLKSKGTQWSRYESGEQFVPFNRFRQISEFLKIPWDEFLAEARRDDPARAKKWEDQIGKFGSGLTGIKGGRQGYVLPVSVEKRLRRVMKEHTNLEDPTELVVVALERYLDQAERLGIKGNFHPIIPTDSSQPQPKPRKTRKKASA